MLHIEVDGGEFFNEKTQEFFQVKPQKLIMEHSLLSMSKWEATWKKPFLSNDNKTLEELYDYFRCMTITPNVSKYTYQCFSQENLKDIHDYIHDPMTATKINQLNAGPRRSRVVTTELIYYWMTANNIPFECEKWHFNRLMMLIQVCGIENNPNKKKMGRQAILRQNAELNAARKAKYHTKG